MASSQWREMIMNDEQQNTRERLKKTVELYIHSMYNDCTCTLSYINYFTFIRLEIRLDYVH